MTIKEYMESNNLTFRQMGERCGLCYSTIYRLVSGERGKKISLSLAQKIVNGTKGKVTLDDIVKK